MKKIIVIAVAIIMTSCFPDRKKVSVTGKVVDKYAFPETRNHSSEYHIIWEDCNGKRHDSFHSYNDTYIMYDIGDTFYTSIWVEIHEKEN